MTHADMERLKEYCYSLKLDLVSGSIDRDTVEYRRGINWALTQVVKEFCSVLPEFRDEEVCDAASR